MGCFLSTNKRYPSSKFHHHSSRSSRAPPPVDVETVKEVLSETPNFTEVENVPKKVLSRQNSHKFRQQDHILNDPNVPEISTSFAAFNHDPPSEIDSTMSESISTTTFDDDYDIYRRKMIEKSPSPSKSRTRNQLSGELLPRKSPVRGKDQSPGRVKMVPERTGRGPGFGSSSRQRPGSGNESAARSKSPANRNVVGGGLGSRNEIGRSLSGRRTGKSPGRVGSDLNERVRKPGSKRFVADSNKDESLENPLVSLECFIFL